METLEEHSWSTLRTKVKEIHPKLGEIIDNLSPSKDYSFYVANYPYGSMILNKGVFHLPNNQKMIVPFHDNTILKKIREDLNYNGTMPVGLISKNSIESFIIFRDRILPSTLFSKGQMIALWRALDDNISYQEGSYWNVSSGARTICMLPKITDKNCHRILKTKYSLKVPTPRHLHDHWNIFSHLATHKNFPSPWTSEVIYFSKNWFTHKNDESWSAFYHFLLNDVWQTSAFTRNQLIFNFIFSVAQENKNLKPSPYLADTVKHLIAIGTGTIPGFATAIDDSSAPISSLQRIFLEDYGLKKYAPIFIQAQHFLTTNEKPVYYSLQMPTTMSFSPKSNRASSTMSQLRELKHLMEVLIAEILKGNLEVNKTPLYNLAQNVKYAFYHTENDKTHEISLANNLIHLDTSFTKTIFSTEKYAFPEYSPFFRGCISISKNT